MNESNKPKRNYLTIEKKIQLFQQYLEDPNTGNTIITNTQYKGYPIGIMLINMRKEIKNEETRKRYSEESIKKLDRMGLLEARNESNAQEKYERLIKFVKEYPIIWKMAMHNNIEKIVNRFLGENEEQKEEVIKQYRLVRKDYFYLTRRKILEKLEPEQIETIRKIKLARKSQLLEEDEIKEIEKIYKIEESSLRIIISQYGSIEEFKKKYIEAIIQNKIETTIPKCILNLFSNMPRTALEKIKHNTKSKLIHYFDITEPDLVLRKENQIELLKEITDYTDDFAIVDAIKIEEYLKKILGILKQNQVNVLKMYYGLYGQERKKIAEIAEKLGQTVANVSFTKRNAINKLRMIHIKKNNSPQFFLNIEAEIKGERKKEFIQKYFKEREVFLGDTSVELDEHTKQELLDMVNILLDEKMKCKEGIDNLNKQPEKKLLRVLHDIFGLVVNIEDLKYLRISNYEEYKNLMKKYQMIILDEETLNNCPIQIYKAILMQALKEIDNMQKNNSQDLGQASYTADATKCDEMRELVQQLINFKGNEKTK